MVSPAGTTPAADGDPRHARIWQVLAEVEDPEIPFLTIVDLGMVRGVRNDPSGDPVVQITPTYSGCPATRMIELQVRAALDRAGFPHARIETVLDPPWTTDWITEEGRRKLREAGIVPPRRGAGCGTPPMEEPGIACPRCGSEDMERLAAFGSTACKALYRCRRCREPFEYFKCL